MAKNYMKLMKDIKPKKYSLQKKPYQGTSKSDHGKSKTKRKAYKQPEYKRSITFKGAAIRPTVGLSTKNKETKKIIT